MYAIIVTSKTIEGHILDNKVLDKLCCTTEQLDVIKSKLSVLSASHNYENGLVLNNTIVEYTIEPVECNTYDNICTMLDNAQVEHAGTIRSVKKTLRNL